MRRFRLTEEQWARILPLLPPERGRTGRPAKDNREMVESILWIARTGAPWRDLPPERGPWSSVYTRFRRWSKDGTLQKVMEALKEQDPDAPEARIIDSTIARAHQHAAGGKGGPRRRHWAEAEEDSRQRSMPM